MHNRRQNLRIERQRSRSQGHALQPEPEHFLSCLPRCVAWRCEVVAVC